MRIKYTQNRIFLLMTINERFEIIIKILFNGNKRAFAKNVGISPTVVENIVGSRKGKPSYDVLEKVCANTNISAEWMLFGTDKDPFKDVINIRKKLVWSATPGDDPDNEEKAVTTVFSKGREHIENKVPEDRQEAIPLAEITEKSKVKPIPLVTETAVAGFGNEYFSIAEKDVKEYYVIPKFRFCRVDFMIEVSGLSMYPHFNPGDVIACTILHDRKFLQWNKCHVIATREQGILVKRLMPSKHEGCLTAISDNKDYPPFDIPIEEITGIALVVGAVSLE